MFPIAKVFIQNKQHINIPNNRTSKQPIIFIETDFFPLNFVISNNNLIINMQKNIVVILTILAVSLANNTSIDAATYAQNLGIGFDVTWSEFSKYRNQYTSVVPQNFSQAGFNNVRIRINQPYPDANFYASLKAQVNDSLNAELLPIIANQAHIIQQGVFKTFEQQIDYLNQFWSNMTTQFLGVSYNLSFNIFVEISGKYKDNSTAINIFYENILSTVRDIDENRILIFPPVRISDPSMLSDLIIPKNNGTIDNFTMAQWHFYAAGPNPDTKSKKYWLNGKTQDQRDGVIGPLNQALAWMNSTGYKTWVGAWMAGNYNKGNNFDLSQQATFGSFMARQLKINNIPWSINAGNKFYDYWNYNWFVTTTDAGGRPVLDAITDPDSIALYQQEYYDGISLRLIAGIYNQSDLSSLPTINSIMVPIDYKVTLYDGPNLTGNTLIIDVTSPSISSFAIVSMKVQIMPFP